MQSCISLPCRSAQAFPLGEAEVTKGWLHINIDRNLLETLAGLDDTMLVASIRAIAAASGVDLTGATFEKAQLDALRTAMRGASDADIARAKEILKGCRKDGKEG